MAPLLISNDASPSTAKLGLVTFELVFSALSTWWTEWFVICAAFVQAVEASAILQARCPFRNPANGVKALFNTALLCMLLQY